MLIFIVKKYISIFSLITASTLTAEWNLLRHIIITHLSELIVEVVSWIGLQTLDLDRLLTWPEHGRYTLCILVDVQSLTTSHPVHK